MNIIDSLKDLMATKKENAQEAKAEASDMHGCCCGHSMEECCMGTSQMEEIYKMYEQYQQQAGAAAKTDGAAKQTASN